MIDGSYFSSDESDTEEVDDANVDEFLTDEVSSDGLPFWLTYDSSTPPQEVWIFTIDL